MTPHKRKVGIPNRSQPSSFCDLDFGRHVRIEGSLTGLEIVIRLVKRIGCCYSQVVHCHLYELRSPKAQRWVECRMKNNKIYHQQISVLA